MSVLRTGEGENATHLTAWTTVTVVRALYVVRVTAIFIHEDLNIARCR